MSDPMYKVNLLPPRMQREEIVDVRRLLLTVVAVVVVLAVIGVVLGFEISYASLKRQIADTNQQLAMLQPTVEMVENLQSQIGTMQSTETDYKNALNRQVTWSDLIYKLNDIAPSDLWLTELDMGNADLSKDPAARQASTAFPAAPGANGVPGANGNVVAMSNAQGSGEPYPYPNEIIIKGMAGSVTSIGIFDQNLNQLPYFKNVVINSIGLQTLNSKGSGGAQASGSQTASAQVEANTFQITAYLR
jgi:Tfp pilus assembly protein PilN